MALQLVSGAWLDPCILSWLYAWWRLRHIFHRLKVFEIDKTWKYCTYTNFLWVLPLAAWHRHLPLLLHISSGWLFRQMVIKLYQVHIGKPRLYLSLCNQVPSRIWPTSLDKTIVWHGMFEPRSLMVTSALQYTVFSYKEKGGSLPNSFSEPVVGTESHYESILQFSYCHTRSRLW